LLFDNWDLLFGALFTEMFDFIDKTLIIACV